VLDRVVGDVEQLVEGAARSRAALSCSGPDGSVPVVLI
jgi:hypothetical protein